MNPTSTPLHAKLHTHLRARPRLAVAIAVGTAAALLAPGAYSPVTRALLGWNVAVWLYLGLIARMMAKADHVRLQRVAIAHAEGAGTVLAIMVLASAVSLFGIVAELTAAKLSGGQHALPHLAFALTTVCGAWLLIPTVFTLTYASLYYRAEQGAGLNFPGADHAFRPNYVDFIYFSFTIAVASQTADVSVTTSPMRRLVLLQSVLSFAFNTAILAFTINLAASMF